VVETAIMATRASIGEGETIAAPLRSFGVFPPMVVQMISVGEEPAPSTRCSRRSPTSTTKRSTWRRDPHSIIEPIMIVVMGLLVGGMVIAMYCRCSS